MTNVATLGIMGALLTGGTFLLKHMLAAMHDKNSVVAVGVDKGVPVSLEYRWVTLLQMVVPVMLLTVVFALLMGFTFMQISDSVEDGGIATLAQVCAWTFFVSAFAGFTIGPLGVLGLAATLRKSKRKLG